MKHMINFMVSILIFVPIVFSKSLTEIYRAGKIELKPVADFGQGNDWQSLFPKGDLHYKNARANFRNLVVSEDGHVYVLCSFAIYKFDPNGRFMLKIGRQGKSPHEFRYIPKFLDLLDNKYLITLNNDGRLKIFDLNGKFIKNIDLRMICDGMTALKRNKVAFCGSKMGLHTLTQIVDIETETILPIPQERPDTAETDKNLTYKIYNKIKKDTLVISTAVKRMNSTFISKTSDGNLIMGYAGQPDIFIFSPTGEEIAQFRLNYQPLPGKPFVHPQIEAWRHIKNGTVPESKLVAQLVENMKKTAILPEREWQKIKNFPPQIQNPGYYYDLKTDSEGNILIFKFNQSPNHFFQVYQVYSKAGKFICESTIDPGQFRNPLTRFFTFHGGALYGILNDQEGDEWDVRLVKVDLTKN